MERVCVTWVLQLAKKTGSIHPACSTGNFRPVNFNFKHISFIDRLCFVSSRPPPVGT